MLDGESAVQCPDNDCGPRVMQVFDENDMPEWVLSRPFEAYGDGWSGFIPIGMQYLGNGEVGTPSRGGGGQSGGWQSGGSGWMQWASFFMPTESDEDKEEKPRKRRRVWPKTKMKRGTSRRRPEPVRGGEVLGVREGDDPRPTDCELLANTVTVIAARGQGIGQLVAALDDRFVERPGDPPTLEFGSSGFREIFREPPGVQGGSPNQVRHYAGILFNAYFGATTLSMYNVDPLSAHNRLLAVANLRERGGNELSQGPDRLLNIRAVSHAVGLAYGTIKPEDLGALIREQICDRPR